MRITNKFGLPEVLVRAASRDPYDKGEADFSATELIKPPRIRALEKMHDDKMEVDVSDRVWSMIGTGVHNLLENGSDTGDIVERRFYKEYSGLKIGAKIDLYEVKTKTLFDWKVTKSKAFSVSNKRGAKPEYIAQLNVCAHLMRNEGINPEKLMVCGILKDFEKHKEIRASDKGYPEAGVVATKLPMYAPDKIEKYIEKRLQMHLAAAEVLPLCSQEDTWRGLRCKFYCDVSSFCDQYQNSLKSGLMEYPKKEIK